MLHMMLQLIVFPILQLLAILEALSMVHHYCSIAIVAPRQVIAHSLSLYIFRMEGKRNV
jgi:hypothetical protein